MQNMKVDYTHISLKKVRWLLWGDINLQNLYVTQTYVFVSVHLDDKENEILEKTD